MTNRLILSIVFLFGYLLLNAQIAISDKEIKCLIKEYKNSDKSDSSIENVFEKLFTKKNSNKNTSSLVNTSDTIFIVEMCDIESGYCYGSVINGKRITNFIFHQNIKISKYQKFSDYTLNLIKSWNISKLNELGKENEIVSSNVVTVIRIILEKEIIIDKINFKEYMGI